MKDDVIDKILSAEKKAEHILLDAEKKAEDVLVQSEIEFDEYKSRLVLDNKKLFKKELEKIEKKQETLYINKVKNFEEKTCQLKEKAENNFPLAIRIILSEVTRL